ncbi:MAG: histidine kinase dimerization/phospho-acceptor domain-containing protein [Pseudomonadota bacterium]
MSLLLILLLTCGMLAAGAIAVRLARSSRETERRLRRLQAALEALGDGFELYDRDDRLVMCNHRFRELQPALPPGGGVGMRFCDILAADIEAGGLAIPPAEVAEWIDHQLRRRRGSLYEEDYPYADGGVVRVVMQRLPDGSMVGTRTDIADLKRRELLLESARQDAEAANRTKSRFLATMSHELRTPLNAVIGFADVLRSELLGPIGSAKYRDYASHIHDSASHLLNVLSDILDMSKVEAGKIDLNETEIDVATMVHEITALFEREAGFAKVALSQDVSSLPPLFADDRYLRQMLINLLSNALKFTAAGGRIEGRGGARRRRRSGDLGRRYRGRHDRRPAPDRAGAVRPDRQSADAQISGHRARPADREVAGRAAWRTPRHRQHAGQGDAGQPDLPGRAAAAAAPAAQWRRVTTKRAT